MSEYQIEQPEQLKAGQVYYRANVRQLSEEESGGRHNIFIDILGLDGTRQSQERFVVYTNEKEVANIAPDKPASERYGADVPMYPGNSYGFRPWTFIGDNVWGFEPGSAYEIRWVAEDVASDGSLVPSESAPIETPTETAPPTEDLSAQVAQALERLEMMSLQLEAMQNDVNQAIADVRELQQQVSG